MAASTKGCNKCFTRAELSTRLLQAGCFLSNLALISFITKAGFRGGILCISPRPPGHPTEFREKDMPRVASKLFLIALAVLVLLGQMFAQGGATGAITGTVLDPSGAVVANADVRIVNQGTGFIARTTKTDANGSFTATLLPVGTYTVNVTSAGFQEAKFPDIAVRVTETTRMEARLRPLAVQEKIEVQAIVQAVETTAATTGQAIDSRTIRNLPLATQNFQQLLTLSAGTNSDLNASASLGRGDVRIQVNGQPRPVVKQNIFGGSLGGPIGKDAGLGFFFVNYQGTRQRSGLSPGALISTGSLPVLPSANRGDPSYAQTLVDTFFPGDPTITAASIDPVALKLLNFRSDQFNDPSGFLFPSADPVTNQFAISKPGRYTDDQFTLNYDKDFRGGLDRISGRFFFTNFESVLPFGAGGLTATLGGTLSPGDLNFPLDLPVHDRFLSVAETHLFSPFLVNELRFGYVRIDNKAINNPIITVNDLGINRPNDNLYKTIYKFTFSAFNFGQIGRAHV